MRFIISKNTLPIALVFLSSCMANVAFANGVSATPSALNSKLDTIAETFGQRYSYESKQLAEKRELLIHLPKEYQESSKPYPVLYVLDGASHFKHAVLASRTLHQHNMMPSSIVVAISNNTGMRNRDVSDGRDNFRAFIRQEVMTFIDENYKTSGHNTLFGHSSMGFVTLEIFAKEPSLFDNYIAASPALESTDTELVKQIEQILTKRNLYDKSVYFSATDKNREIPGFTDGAISLAKLFTEKAPNELSWQYNFIPNQQHMTTPYLTLYAGLSMVFNDYQAPAYVNYQDFIQSGGMKEFTARYSKRSEKYGTRAQAPEQDLINLSNMLAAEGHHEEALEILLAFINKNKQALRTYNALAEIYQQIGEPQRAIAAYQNAILISKEIAPQYTSYFENQITKIEQKS